MAEDRDGVVIWIYRSVAVSVALVAVLCDDCIKLPYNVVKILFNVGADKEAFGEPFGGGVEVLAGVNELGQKIPAHELFIGIGECNPFVVELAKPLAVFRLDAERIERWLCGKARPAEGRAVYRRYIFLYKPLCKRLGFKLSARRKTVYCVVRVTVSDYKNSPSCSIRKFVAKSKIWLRNSAG